MKKILSVVLFTCIGTGLFAQMKGLVQGSNNARKTPLYGAKLKLLNAGIGAVTSAEGTFEIILPKDLPDTLVISAIGYASDTLVVDKADRFISLEIVLYSDQLLPEMLVELRRDSHSISRLKTLHVEELTSSELRKAACCNLSESFETNASVDVSVTDAVSGARKIRMMGIDGVYTQIQMENIPYLRGLESAFGLNSIPGSWIESIQITKGTGNVANGYESMAGLINLELKKPREMERFYANAYGNIFGRAELNLNAGHIINDKWSVGWMAHASGVFAEMDNNGDGFRDLPMGKTASFLNRWDYRGKKMEAQFGFNAYSDEKSGGQVGFKSGDELPLMYGVSIATKHVDAFAKTGFFLKKPTNSIGIVYNLKYQTVDATFGLQQFYGEEKRGYINAIYDGIIGTTDHKIKVGASAVYVNLIQHLDALASDRMEIVPGAFAEYTYTGMRLSTVVGARGDFHNLYGFQFSPRLHTKYALTEKLDIRFTAGKGWRVPNYMIDNLSLLASSRTWVAPAGLKPEVSWNFGGSLVQEFKVFKRKANVTLDFYHTFFQNQLVVDRDFSNTQIYFFNLNGISYSNSFQGEVSFLPMKNLELRFAYKFLDVKSEFGGSVQQQVMVPRHRGFFNAAYFTRNKRWEFDFTASVYGTSRLTALPGILIADQDLQSPVYPIVNAQITHIYKKWNFYIGGENLTNYRQLNPIVDAENPFGANFDATRIWGPVMGINVYLGVRYALKRSGKS
jgi:outer membrane receptor for ferrienterochelin and colicins